jgi:hypothetical protein
VSAIEFFGTWEVAILGPAASLSQWSLQLSGTAGRDGTFALTDGQPETWPVTGGQWTLTVLAWFEFSTPGWYPTKPRVSKHFEAGVGLVIDVTACSGSDLVSPPLQVHCVNVPAYPTPVVANPPFNFGIPER